MHTKHVEYLLPEYLDGTLPDGITSGVEEHLRNCSACSTELAELRRTMDLLGAQTSPDPPGGYFTTVLPRVRARLEEERSRSFLTNPLWTRFVLPVGAAVVVLFILLSLPFQANKPETGQNPLQAVVHGSTTGDVVDAVFDMVPLQPLSSPIVEREMSALLGTRILHEEQLLTSSDEMLAVHELTLDERMPEGLEQLNEADLEDLVQRLGERTTL